MRLLLIAIFIFIATKSYAQPIQAPSVGDAVRQLTQPPPRSIPEAQQRLHEAQQTLGGIAQGAPGVPNVAGCQLDQLVKAIGDIGSIAAHQAEELKKVNDELAKTAKNVGDAQLAIIKETTEEAGNVLLSPFKPLIDIAKHALEYYNWLKDKLEHLAWQLVFGFGAAIGFMVGLPILLLIRAITPRAK